MIKNDDVYLQHIRQCLDEISLFTKNGENSFFNDVMVRNATLRSLQVMAESITKLSKKYQDTHSEIPWREISGFRNILVHDYLGLDYKIVWSVIESELPKISKIVSKKP